MSDNLELLTNRGRPPAGRPASPLDRSVSAVDGNADEDECPAFGYLRGIRDRALTIEFRLSNGNSEAFPYSWLGPIKYNPSAGLLLKFVGDETYLVLVEGSNLNTLVNGSVNLYDRGVQRHRVTWIRESRKSVGVAEGVPIVDAIKVGKFDSADQMQIWLKKTGSAFE